MPKEVTDISIPQAISRKGVREAMAEVSVTPRIMGPFSTPAMPRITPVVTNAVP